jgi:hypothetical protein
VVDRPPDQGGQPAAGGQDPGHLGQGGRSGKNWRPAWQQIAWKLPSGNGSRPGLACTRPVGAPSTGRLAATAGMPG